MARLHKRDLLPRRRQRHGERRAALAGAEDDGVIILCRCCRHGYSMDVGGYGFEHDDIVSRQKAETSERTREQGMVKTEGVRQELVEH